MFGSKVIIGLILSVIIFANGLTLFAEKGNDVRTAEFTTPYGAVYSSFK